MTAGEHKQPEDQDDAQLVDLEVDESADEVRGGMTKQENVQQLGSRADLSKG
jgi:hypothetical protein